jgi:hypothetical protein
MGHGPGLRQAKDVGRERALSMARKASCMVLWWRSIMLRVSLISASFCVSDRIAAFPRGLACSCGTGFTDANGGFVGMVGRTVGRIPLGHAAESPSRMACSLAWAIDNIGRGESCGSAPASRGESSDAVGRARWSGLHGC